MRRPGTKRTGRKAEGRLAVEPHGPPPDPESLLLQVHRFLETEAPEEWAVTELVAISRCERQIGSVIMRMSIEVHSSGLDPRPPGFQSVIDVNEEWGPDSPFRDQDAAIQAFVDMDHALSVIMRTAGYATRRYFGSDRLIMRYTKDLPDLKAVRREIEWLTHFDLGMVGYLDQKVREARIEAATATVPCEVPRPPEPTPAPVSAVPCRKARCTD